METRVTERPDRSGTEDESPESPGGIPTPPDDDAPDGAAPGPRDDASERAPIRTPSVEFERTEPRRFPGWILVLLGGIAGGIVADWMGLGFGALVGLLIWRSRAG